MIRPKRDIIDRNAYRRPLDLDPRQDSTICELLTNAAHTLSVLTPDTASLTLKDYQLSNNFRLDTDLTIDQGNLHGEVSFRDITRNSPPLELTRPPRESLWATTSPVRTSMATTDNYPNQAIVEQIRNYAPTLPMSIDILKSPTDLALFQFLANALKRNGGKKREQTQLWKTKDPQPHLRFGSYTSGVVREFGLTVLNGSPSYTFSTRTPGLPTADGHKIAIEHRLSAKNVNQRARTTELSIVHHGLRNALDEESQLTAQYASRGSNVDPDDAIVSAEESLRQLIESVFTIDRLV